MILRPALLGYVQDICLQLRPSDIREVWALRGDAPTRASRLDLARHVHACSLISPWAQTAWADDEPIAVFVAAPRTPTTCDAIFLATDRWMEIAAPFTRHVKRRIAPGLIRAGIKRLEARIWDGHEACRWADFLGGRSEARIEGYGKNGETYVQYAWSAIT